MGKGRLLQFRSPGNLRNRSLPLVGLTLVYSSSMSYRYVGSKVSLNRETLLAMGATEGCEDAKYRDLNCKKQQPSNKKTEGISKM